MIYLEDIKHTKIYAEETSFKQEALEGTLCEYKPIRKDKVINHKRAEHDEAMYDDQQFQKPFTESGGVDILGANLFIF